MSKELPSYDIRLKIYNFSLDILKAKDYVESNFKPEELEKVHEYMESQKEKLSKHFSLDEQELFERIYLSSIFAFSRGMSIDTDGIRKELENDRQNSLN